MTVASPLQIREFRHLLPISLVVALGFGLVLPVLPLFARSFGVGLALVGLVQFVFGFTRFSSGLAAGLVVDRFGERAGTVAGILVVAASSYASGFSGSFAQLVVARGFGGAGSALFVAGLMNRMLKVVPSQAMGRATGLWRASFLVGIGAGPLIGGIVGESLGVRAPFHIYGTGLLVAAAVAAVSMRQKRGSDAGRRPPLEALRVARPLLRDLRYVVALVATLAGWWTLSGPAQQIGALYANERLGFSPSRIGLGITLLAVGQIVALAVAGRAADRRGRRVVLVPALATTALATGLLGQIEAAPWAFFPLLVAIGAGVSAGGVAAGGLLADAVPKGGSGTAVGVNQMAGDLGYMLAPAALGFVAQGAGFGPGYLLGALPSALALAVALRLPRGKEWRAAEVSGEPFEAVG